MNTKIDYEYIREHNIPGWQREWYMLLDGRWIVEGYNLVEDANAKIFRLGFTVAEVEDTIRHEGYTVRQLEWFASQPTRFTLAGGVYTEVAGWAAAKVTEDAAKAVADSAFEQRVLGIVAAKEAAGLKAYTMAQATTYINNKMATGTTVPLLNAAVKEILLKMVPYVL